MLEDNIYEERARRWLQPDRAEQAALSSSAACQQETPSDAIPVVAASKRGAHNGTVDTMEMDQEPALQSMVPGSNADRSQGEISGNLLRTQESSEHLSQLPHLNDFLKIHLRHVTSDHDMQGPSYFQL